MFDVWEDDDVPMMTYDEICIRDSEIQFKRRMLELRIILENPAAQTVARFMGVSVIDFWHGIKRIDQAA